MKKSNGQIKLIVALLPCNAHGFLEMDKRFFFVAVCVIDVAQVTEGVYFCQCAPLVLCLLKRLFGNQQGALAWHLFECSAQRLKNGVKFARVGRSNRSIQTVNGGWILSVGGGGDQRAKKEHH